MVGGKVIGLARGEGGTLLHVEDTRVRLGNRRRLRHPAAEGRLLPLRGACVVWYLDCHSWKALGGRDFPVNSYYHECLEILIGAANRLLASGVAGIDETRISRETRGRNPMYYRDQWNDIGFASQEGPGPEPCRG